MRIPHRKLAPATAQRVVQPVSPAFCNAAAPGARHALAMALPQVARQHHVCCAETEAGALA